LLAPHKARRRRKLTDKDATIALVLQRGSGNSCRVIMQLLPVINVALLLTATIFATIFATLFVAVSAIAFSS
jgi:hypothetical protein